MGVFLFGIIGAPPKADILIGWNREGICMEKIKITLKDGSVKEVDKGITLQELAAFLSRSLAKSALAAKVNGKVMDLPRTL
jgi:hypothetical protein